MTLLYGSQQSSSILCDSLLASWSKTHADQLTVVHVISNEPSGTSWTGAKGHIDAELIKAHLPGPKEDVEVFVCGPPGMYEAVCGGRGEEDVTGALGKVGYGKEQVTKF